jgi:hypothetical protein
MKKLLCALLAAPLGLAACGGGSGDGGNGQHEADDMCDEVSSTSVGWDEATAIGTPSELFGAVGGSCDAPFAWSSDSSEGSALSVDPASGEGTASATVIVDEASARLVVQTGPEEECGDYLAVDAAVTLELLGSAVATAATAMVVSYGTAPEQIQLQVDGAGFDAWAAGAEGISFALEEGAFVDSMSADIAPLANGCAGTLNMVVQYPPVGDTVAAEFFALGSWSDADGGV